MNNAEYKDHVNDILFSQTRESLRFHWNQVLIKRNRFSSEQFFYLNSLVKEKESYLRSNVTYAGADIGDAGEAKVT
jgi:hypothetical protein